MPADTASTAAPAIPPPTGHPRGLRTLFFTEMWERCSYYGMRAILILFLTSKVGGMAMTTGTAAAIYGLCTSFVYLSALPGGWIADRFLGAQRAVWYGGILIAAGDFMLAIPATRTFYVGMLLIIMGTGLLKPNVSAIVGALYPEGGARRDAGFSIFYMGINVGALVAPLICSTIAEKINWRYGFAAPGIGMIFGLAQYRWQIGTLGDAGKYPGHREGAGRKDRALLLSLLTLIVVITGLALAGIITINPHTLASWLAYIIMSLAVVYFMVAFAFFKLNGTEMKRVVVIIILFICSALFWSGFEQAGSSFNLFAQRYTLRTRGFDFDTFSPDDLKNLPLFATKLTSHDEPVANFVWTNCIHFTEQIKHVDGTVVTNNTQSILRDYLEQTNAYTRKASHFLVQELDGIIESDHAITEDASFAGITLSRQTQELLAEHEELKKNERELKEEKLVRLNRFLLEDAFSSSLSQNQSVTPSFTIPAGWFQSLGPLFVVMLSPLAAAIWVFLARRKRDPSLPAKFGLGLIFLGLGFLVIAAAALFVGGHKVGPLWLTAVFFIHTLGELCISPVGLSSVTKLAPKRMVGQMMGVWFLATSLGNLIAGLIAGSFDPENVDQMPALLMNFVYAAVGTGLLVLILSKPIKKLMAGVE